MLIDSHAHLADLSDSEFAETVQRAADSSVGMILNVGTSIESSRRVLEQCGLSSVPMAAAAGISPPDISAVSDGWESELEKLLQHPNCAAVGEIGIDSVNSSYPSMEFQMPFFEKQLELAVKYDLPAIIHARGAETEALAVCRRLGVRKALFHCFTGSNDQASAVVEAGYSISFSGIITFKNSGYDDAVSMIPAEQLLFETDSPYLAPVPVRGKKNEPANVQHIYHYAAKVRSVSAEVLKRQTMDHFKKLFSVDF